MENNLHYIAEIPSTNTRLIAEAMERSLPQCYTLYTFNQTAGRGQRGNGWECAPEQNIAFTMAFRDVSSLPRLNMLVPVVIREVLADVLGASLNEQVCVKWPNDIYVADQKIAGILIENVWQGGQVICSVAGVGINVHQTVFFSGAPNPVSLTALTGLTYDMHALMARIYDAILSALPLLNEPSALKAAYLRHLYRREGFWPYRERLASAAPMMPAFSAEDSSAFLARIADITDAGELVLAREDGTTRTYQFKEICYILPSRSL